MKNDAKEKFDLMLRKMEKGFGKDFEKIIKECYTKYPNENDALVAAFNTILYKKMDKRLQERGSNLRISKLINLPPAKLNLTEDEIKELEKIEHEVYMEWLGFDPKNPEEPLVLSKEVLSSEKKLFSEIDEVSKLPYIPINYEFYELVPYIIPYRISNRNLKVRKVLEDGSLSLIFKVGIRDKIVIFSFLIPSEVLGTISERDIPMVGLNMRRALFASLGLVFVQGNPITFKRSDLLKLMGEDTHKNPSLYRDLVKGVLTWVYATYTIVHGNKVLEAGHIVNRIKLPSKRGDTIIMDFNSDLVKPLMRSMLKDQKTSRFVPYSMDFLKVKPKDMDFHTRNFCESLLKFKGLGKNIYPKQVEKYLIEDFGFSPKDVKKLRKIEIDTLIREACNAAKNRRMLINWKFTPESVKKYPLNILKWRLKINVP